MAQRFISIKELAAAYGIHVNTMRKELRLQRKLKLLKNQKYLNLNEQKIIYSNLGNPFEK